MIVEIEHSLTGERKMINPGAGQSYPIDQGWHVIFPEIQRPVLDAPQRLPELTIRMLPQGNNSMATLATMISAWGLPLASALSALRWLFGKNCPYCQAGGEFLRLLEGGKITESDCRDLVAQVLNAKDQKDEIGLQRLKGRLEELRESR